MAGMCVKLFFRRKLFISTVFIVACYFLLVTLFPAKESDTETSSDKEKRLNYVPQTRKMQVHKYLNKEWILDGNTCRSSEWFLSGILLDGPQGTLPIYIHSPLADQYVSGDIIRKGQWEPGYVKFLHEYLLNDTSLDFIDIGANIGVYTLTMAKLGRNVIAVEPFKPNIARLCRTLEDNRVDDKVTLITNPLSNNRTTVVMQEQFGNIGGTHTKEYKGIAKGKLDTVTLDDVLRLKTLKRVIMKMDVESYENKVLQGGKEFFEKVDVRLILMEWIQHKQSEDAPDIIRFLTRRNMYPHTVEKIPVPLELYFFSGWPADVLWIKKSNKNPWMKYLQTTDSKM